MYDLSGSITARHHLHTPNTAACSFCIFCNQLEKIKVFSLGVLVCNHPSGDPTPSKADIQMTRAVANACATLSTDLHGHLIIGRAGHASLRGLGLM